MPPPRHGYSVLHDDEHDEQRYFVNHEEPTIDQPEGQEERLYDAYPEKVVELIPANGQRGMPSHLMDVCMKQNQQRVMAVFLLCRWASSKIP